MRNNQPVTNREIFMKDGSVIVSRTDVHGRITAVNGYFIEISGYEKEELIGQPHNLIRHPDMPTEAFEDMWRDIKDGKAWNGYVKNRTKDGDHYWVQANAMPLTENGQVTGFVSVRNKPDAATTKMVEGIYKQFREGSAKGLSIQHGQVISHNLKNRIARWNARLGNKMLSTMAVLCLLLCLVGASGEYVATSIEESLRTVYEDRTIPAGQLEDIEQHNYDTLVEMFSAANDNKDPAPVVAKIEENLTVSNKVWGEYMATYLTPEEKILAKDYSKKRDALNANVIKPALGLLKESRYDELKALLSKSNDFLDEVAEANGKLIELQMNVAADEYKKAKTHARVGFWSTIGVIFIAVLLALAGLRFMRRALANRLDYLDDRLTSIVGGNYQTEVETGHDELQNIMTTVRALQAKLAYGEFEKQEAEREKHVMQERLANDFEQSVKGIVGMVAAAATELSQTATSMVTTVMESASKATDATGAASVTASNVQAVAAAAEEMSASVREISSQLQKTTRLVGQSQERTHGADVVANALTTASDKVTKAMEMIAGISGQINLLALNATIESARAGEAGKGFAVVASEVKNLAGQTDRTVAEIQTVVEEMRKASQDIIIALGGIGESVTSITEASASVASAVEEQSAVTGEIARNMQNAASGTQTISENLQEVVASSNHAGSASEQMLMASKDLSQQAENLNAQVDEFLRRIRAA